MKTFMIALLLFSLNFGFAQTIPKGDIKGPFQWQSKIYPGTQRQYWIYVPKQYQSTTPACLMVVQDGLSRATGWNLPVVMDSLIAIKKIPVMIGVFVDHGVVSATDAKAFPRYNRSFEYDAMGDLYARFLLEELLPEIQRTYNISANPNDRSIAGASSGAICAFNVAWERPDQFRRVLSTIGTYVGLRGGDEFVTLVRKSESKPIRVYLEDGNQDLNIYAGDWWMANQAMLSALTYAGYEVNHAWGTGGHDSKHALSILPEALSWLWEDYPAPVERHKGVQARINLLIENEAWTEIPIKALPASHLAVDNKGGVFFSAKNSIYKVSHDGKVESVITLESDAAGLCFSSDGVLYVSIPSRKKIVAIGENKVPADVVKNCEAEFMCATDKGLYFSEGSKKRIGLYRPDTKKTQYFSTPFQPSSISVNAEKTFMNVGGIDTPFGYSFQINRDGSLSNSQPYIHYHWAYGETVPDVGGMTVDSQNLLYTSSNLGVQVSDQLGRVNFIFDCPGKSVSDVKLGGPNMDILYILHGDKLFSRKIAAKGLHPWDPAVTPPKPGL